MAHIKNVTVNGRPVAEYLDREQSREIQQFLAEELRSMCRSTRSHISTRPSGRAQSKPVDVGNGSIRFA